MSALDALAALDFGSVDSEFEDDLDLLFVRTSDFDKFLLPKVWLALGAKGTGKSALFELFEKGVSEKGVSEKGVRDNF